ncbi:hypothetical protein ACPEEZ_08800 [Frigoribacterium sp. 2-23]|uniref:hypothetical protein n=1 Tax=Frigoribacterium sp. 2-23 TaxID=3415006 RepID=UPI003C6ED5D0
MSTQIAPSRPPRNAVLAVLDVVAGAALSVVSVLVAGACLLLVAQLQVSAVVVVGTVVVVFATAFGIGLFLVRALQRRYGAWWPVVGSVVTVAAFYVAGLVAVAIRR